MPHAIGAEVKIFYEIPGRSGDPTVLVHGSWADHSTWTRVVAPLASSLHLMTYDRRGHGSSTGPRRANPVRDDVADLAFLLESVDLYPAHVIGHSYGGAVALRLALDRPELVRSVAVHEPPFLSLLEGAEGKSSPDATEARFEIRRLQGLARSGRHEETAQQFAERFDSGPGAWNRLDPAARSSFTRHAPQWADEMDDPDATTPSRSELATLDLPVLLTTGERSLPLFHEIEGELRRALRNAVARVLPGTGHVPHLTDPEVYAGAIATFLLERDVPST
ncbi:MAG: alpha/beta hydrolase [Thermoplasmata archaeon]